MSNAKKILLTLLLLTGAAFVIHAFTTDRSPEGFRYRAISGEEFAAAERFAAELTALARKGAAREFARLCLDARDKTTAISWRDMRKFGSAPARLVKVSSFEKEPERCRLHLENGNGLVGTAICRKEAGGEWKFISFTCVDPAEKE